jgi:hypothetical protein
VDAAARLDMASSPDVFIAEPVGSCTDLVATVTYPLRRIYGDSYSIAPLSVLVDPVRAERVLGLSEGGKFSEKVRYIYHKQLEEADLIVIAKSDLLDDARCERLRARLAAEFPHAKVLALSVRLGIGLDSWFAAIADAEQGGRDAMDVDYEIYAEGEALLGWLNSTVQFTADAPFDSEPVLLALARGIHAQLAGAEIAHLKMTLNPIGGLGDIAVVNLVRSDFVPELGLRLDAPVTGGQLIVNLRAEAAPEALRDAVRESVETLGTQFPGLRAELDHLEFFRPGKPQPTHRLATMK